MDIESPTVDTPSGDNGADQTSGATETSESSAQTDAPSSKVTKDDADAPKSGVSIRDALMRAKSELESGKGKVSREAYKDGPNAGSEGDQVAANAGGEVAGSEGDATADLPAPARFTKAAKAAWANTDPTVRTEVTRAISEIEKGLSEKSAALAPLQPFLDLASAAKVDAAATLQGYIDTERALMTDPAKGLRVLTERMGLSPRDVMTIFGGQAQGQVQQTRNDPKDTEIATLRRELESIKGTMQTQTRAQTERQLQEFAQTHPRMDELSEEIARQITAGFDLSEAYDRAERLNPLPTITTDTVATAQTRARKSVTGKTSGGSNPSSAPPKSVREAIERAASGYLS